jgi:hypothetical protein
MLAGRNRGLANCWAATTALRNLAKVGVGNRADVVRALDHPSE